jgi:hypothetical protein
MGEHLHLGIRGIAHAESERIAAAALAAAERAGKEAGELVAAVSPALAEGGVPPRIAGLPSQERVGIRGRTRGRVLSGAATPILSKMVTALAESMATETERLHDFACTVDLLLAGATPAGAPSLVDRLRAVRVEYIQIAKPDAELAWAAHAAVRQGLAHEAGFSAMVLRITMPPAVVPAGGAGAEPPPPSAEDVQRALVRVAQNLSLRILDAIDLHLDAARGGE